MGVALYRFSGGLFFANIDRFQRDVEKLRDRPGIRAVIVDASGIVSVDLTSAEGWCCCTGGWRIREYGCT